MDWTLAQNGYRIERQFRPVSVIWIFYILPATDEAVEGADTGFGKCSPPAEVKQSTGQESHQPGLETNKAT
uniref:Uncharacterized protein n=1 Tax=Anopheles atroparvus TaxID=41427 RepID=A0AAG5DVX5_ANOAO